MLKIQIFLAMLLFGWINAASARTIPDWLVDVNGILWHRCSIGQVWDAAGAKCSGRVAQMDLMEAIAAADRKNDSDLEWDHRLPWVHELVSIVDCGDKSTRATVLLPGQTKELTHWCMHGAKRPALDDSIFPGSLASFYWTQTKSKTNPNGVDFYWGLNFEFGVLNDSITAKSKIAVRLVASPKPAMASNEDPVIESGAIGSRVSNQTHTYTQKLNSARQGEKRALGAVELTIGNKPKGCEKYATGSSVKIPVAGYPRPFNGLVISIRTTTINARILDKNAPIHLNSKIFMLSCFN